MYNPKKGHILISGAPAVGKIILERFIRNHSEVDFGTMDRSDVKAECYEWWLPRLNNKSEQRWIIEGSPLEGLVYPALMSKMPSFTLTDYEDLIGKMLDGHALVVLINSSDASYLKNLIAAKPKIPPYQLNLYANVNRMLFALGLEMMQHSTNVFCVDVCKPNWLDLTLNYLKDQGVI